MDSLDPQSLYNAARNIEIVAWKIANARNANGDLMLLNNEQNENERNLSFEREFSKMIGRTDLLRAFACRKISTPDFKNHTKYCHFSTIPFLSHTRKIQFHMQAVSV